MQLKGLHFPGHNFPQTKSWNPQMWQFISGFPRRIRYPTLASETSRSYSEKEKKGIGIQPIRHVFFPDGQTSNSVFLEINALCMLAPYVGLFWWGPFFSLEAFLVGLRMQGHQRRKSRELECVPDDILALSWCHSVFNEGVEAYSCLDILDITVSLNRRVDMLFSFLLSM